MHCAFMYFQVTKLTFEMKGIIAKYLSLLEIRFETSFSISPPLPTASEKKNLRQPHEERWVLEDKYIGVNLFYWLFMQKPIKVDHDCY